MNPRLAAVAGPLKGSVIGLSDDPVSIGRVKSNKIRLNSNSVSRRHCLIETQADNFKITDLGSQNGTHVNGVPVQVRALENGDQIRIGDTLFVFLDQAEESFLDSNPVELTEDASTTRFSLEFPVEQARYLQAPATQTDSAGSAARTVRDLSALVKISATINSIQGVEPLARQILESAFQIVPAERGVLLLTERHSGELSPIIGVDRLAGPTQTVRVSQTIVRRVLAQGTAIMSNDVVRSGDFDSSPSVMSANIRSLLAAPLVALDKKIGVVYMDSSDTATRFDEDHLQLLTAIAGMGAVALENARQMDWLRGENLRLQEGTSIEHDMVGESPAMRKVHDFIARVAPTDAVVLLTGESGTGKELVARAIHQNSPRAGKPFVAINCAALAPNLLESELFGHERGAFTGAIAQKKGKIEIADGGTFFLDEIGELDPTLQAKLLRVLQHLEFERVGGTRPIKVDVRIIAATNKDLKAAIRGGGFREDLYYRINVVSLSMPPLRDRREDIPLLASYFTSKYGVKCSRRIAGISEEARRWLLNYDWPGNVRELENAIERAIVLGTSDVILPEDLPEDLLNTETSGGAPITRYHEAILEAKRDLIVKSFKEAKGSHAAAAKRLGVHPNYLHRLIRNMNIKAVVKKQS